jgi:hypothetical protein
MSLDSEHKSMSERIAGDGLRAATGVGSRMISPKDALASEIRAIPRSGH